jgi:hypothetical protein
LARPFTGSLLYFLSIYHVITLNLNQLKTEKYLVRREL